MHKVAYRVSGGKGEARVRFVITDKADVLSRGVNILPDVLARDDNVFQAVKVAEGGGARFG